MQQYIITSFISNGNLVYRLNTGGKYTLNGINYPREFNGIKDEKHLNDFICNLGFRINSIKDQINNEEYTIGDIVYIKNSNSESPFIIRNFLIKNKDVVLVFSNTNISGSSLRMINATKKKKVQSGIINNNTLNLNTSTEDKTDKFHQLRKSIEKTYTGQEIRLEKTLRKRKETIQQFLIDFFEEHNEEKDTIYVETKEVQTLAGKRRSLGDIYMILKYYYPKTTLEEVIKLLYVTLPQYYSTEGRSGFRSCKCSQIHKRVWYYSEGDANNNANVDVVDEYGHKMAYYTTKLAE